MLKAREGRAALLKGRGQRPHHKKNSDISDESLNAQNILGETQVPERGMGCRVETARIGQVSPPAIRKKAPVSRDKTRVRASHSKE